MIKSHTTHSNATRHRITSGLVALLVCTLSLAVSCTGVGEGEKKSRGSNQVTAVPVGPDGRTVESSDKVVSVLIRPGAAQPDSSVTVSTASGREIKEAPGLQPLIAFDISVVAGQVDSGEVSVRYDPNLLRQEKSSPGLLVMLMSDHNGGWVPLPTTANESTHVATASWPHFSEGILGYIRAL